MRRLFPVRRDVASFKSAAVSAHSKFCIAIKFRSGNHCSHELAACADALVV
jgi:hypothetical protein